MTKKVTVKFARQQVADLKMEILNAIDNMHLSAMTITGSTCFAGNILDRVTLEKQVKACYRHVNALNQKYWKLVEIIARSDATTYIEIPSGKMTIARARMMKDELENKEDERFTKKMIHKLNCEYVGAAMSIAEHGTEKRKKVFQEMKEKMKWLLSGEDAELIAKAEQHAGEYAGRRLDPININGELDKLIKYEKMLPHEIAYLICVSNQNTYIDVD